MRASKIKETKSVNVKPKERKSEMGCGRFGGNEARPITNWPFYCVELATFHVQTGKKSKTRNDSTRTASSPQVRWYPRSYQDNRKKDDRGRYSVSLSLTVTRCYVILLVYVGTFGQYACSHCRPLVSGTYSGYKTYWHSHACGLRRSAFCQVAQFSFIYFDIAD